MARTDYSREELVAICEQAVVPESKWCNRDSPGAHEQLGLCWVMLKAGCDFDVHPAGDSGCFTNERTIWVTVYWKNFCAFEYGSRERDDKTFYLPTPASLEKNQGRDWY